MGVGVWLFVLVHCLLCGLFILVCSELWVCCLMYGVGTLDLCLALIRVALRD